MRLLVCLLLLTTFALAGNQAPSLPEIGRVEPAAADETSGAVRSCAYPGVYWIHNDSGDSARFFAIDASGKAVGRAEGIELRQASNTDWEDVAYDGDNLYFADTGNNGNARRDLGVYVVAEPNPRETSSTRAVRWMTVAYPDQKQFPPSGAWEYDCEAVFWLRGRLYFVTKHRNGRAGLPVGAANLYRLDTAFTDRVNVLRKLDGRNDLGGWVTAADVSPDGSRLAVLTQAPVQSVWDLFDPGAGRSVLDGGRWAADRVPRRAALRGNRLGRRPDRAHHERTASDLPAGRGQVDSKR